MTEDQGPQRGETAPPAALRIDAGYLCHPFEKLDLLKYVINQAIHPAANSS
jgi:hypothetical protein